MIAALSLPTRLQLISAQDVTELWSGRIMPVDGALQLLLIVDYNLTRLATYIDLSFFENSAFSPAPIFLTVSAPSMTATFFP